jgi:hypothetical protein
MSFPKFPSFRKFSINDKEDYIQHYSQLTEAYCDFSLDDLCIWLNYNDDLEVAELNNNLVLRFSNILDDNKQYYSLIGTHHLGATVKDLLELTPTISYIPQQLADHIQQLQIPHIKIQEDIDDREYIYRVNDLVQLQGKPYENLRRRINHFQKQNTNIQTRRFDLQNQDNRKVIVNTINRWSQGTTASHNDPQGLELNVIKKHLELADHLPVHAYGLYVENQLVNINMFNLPPHKDWLIFNHIKCDYTYKDIYGYAFHDLSRIAQSLGIKWINFEQDLGIEGLRRIKTFFRPYKLLHRYTVSLDPDAKYQ